MPYLSLVTIRRKSHPFGLASCHIHLEGLVKNLSIRVYTQDEAKRLIEQDRNLLEPLQ